MTSNKNELIQVYHKISMASMIFMPALPFFCTSEADIKRCLIDVCGYDAASQAFPQVIQKGSLCDAYMMGH